MFCTSPKQNAGKLLTLRANGQAQEGEIGEASIPILHVNPTSAYSLSGMVFHHPTSFILDTGAAVTLLRKDTWDHARPRAAELETWKEPKLISVDGSPLHIHGHAEVKINLSDMEFSHHVVIAEDLSSEAILGLDFLEAQGCTINTRHRTVTFEDAGEILELNCAKTTQKNNSSPVSLIETIRIPAWSELEVMAQVENKNLHQEMMLEPTNMDRIPVRVARGLVLPTTEGVPVRLLNTGTEPVTVHKGTTLGIVEQPQTIIAAPVCAHNDANDNKIQICLNEISNGKRTMLWILYITQQLDDKVSPEEKNQLFLLLHAYADIYAESTNELGRTHCTQHTINTGNATPIRQRPRRIPAAYRMETKQLLQEMLQKDTIRPSASPWASPVVLVCKKTGALRFCVDYRKVNGVTKNDAYPLPRVDDTLDTLAGAQWFTTLDLISGYWQVELAPSDQEKSAFCTPEGLYEFNVMPLLEKSPRLYII